MTTWRTRDEAVEAIRQRQPVPYNVARRYGLNEYRRGLLVGAVAALLSVLLLLVLGRTWPW